MFPLDRLLPHVVRHGRLTLIDHRGRARGFGEPGAQPAVTIGIHDPKLYWAFALNPDLYIGRAYTDGTLTLEQGSLDDFLEILLISSRRFRRGGSAYVRALKNVLRAPALRNWRKRARANVHHHYDLSGALFELFLDRDRQYSCAYFKHGDEDIDLAQLRKKQHIAAKLHIRPGQHILDIGCGWGGLALYLAQAYDVQVTGLTLSDEQFKLARERAEAAGVSDRVTFKLLDYRDETGLYDRIVSVGMFEHVGWPFYDQYFRAVRARLKDDGVALIHTIGLETPPAPINSWIRQNIFPGAYLPALSQLAPIFERLDLWLTDFESLRLHYAETLRAWNARFQANRDKAAALYDERFCRMWEFYLLSCEAGFRYSGLTVFQMQLAKRIDALPLTRDYIFDEERRLATRDAEVRFKPRLAGE